MSEREIKLILTFGILDLAVEQAERLEEKAEAARMVVGLIRERGALKLKAVHKPGGYKNIGFQILDEEENYSGPVFSSLAISHALQQIETDRFSIELLERKLRDLEVGDSLALSVELRERLDSSLFKGSLGKFIR